MQNLMFRSFIRFTHKLNQHTPITQPQTYYDILKLRKDCTSKEIKDAYVKLSKQYHPDTKGAINTAEPKQSEKFIKLSEAYKVLSRPETRRIYDRKMHVFGLDPISETTVNSSVKTEMHRPWEIKPDYDPNPGPYYGIKGVSKLSNSMIVMGVGVLIACGLAFGYVSVNYSVTFNRQVLDQKSEEASRHHAAIRANAEKFGNEEQLRRMVSRLAEEK